MAGIIKKFHSFGILSWMNPKIICVYFKTHLLLPSVSSSILGINESIKELNGNGESSDNLRSGKHQN